jgi:hypothetical protein
MQADWTTLPEELAYLRGPAMKYGTYVFQKDRDELQRKISERELSALAELAKRVRAPGEAERIYQWRRQHWDSEESNLVAWLLQVIQELVPEIPDDCSRLNWGDLPPELDFLREPSCRYGKYWLGEERMGLINRLTKDEWVKIYDVAARVRTPQAKEAVDLWLGSHPPFVHGSAGASASTLVYLFIDLLGELVPEI